MAVFFLMFIILPSIVVSSTIKEMDNYCLPWMVFESGVCLCRDLHDSIMTVFCDPKTQVTYTVAGTCVTYANSNREIVIGDCPYVPAKHVSYEGKFLTALPQNESLLSEVMCGPFNCQGLLSYTKVIFVSFGLLYKTSIYNGEGTVISQSLRFDP